MSRVLCSKHELYNLSSIEVAADEFAVGGVFLERHDGEVVGFHDGVAYSGDALKEILGIFLGGTREGFNEDDAGIWLLVAAVEALNTEGHLDGWRMVSEACRYFV